MAEISCFRAYGRSLLLANLIIFKLEEKSPNMVNAKYIAKVINSEHPPLPEEIRRMALETVEKDHG